MRTLCVKKISDADIGTYKCIAQNKEGERESAGSLEIVEFIEKGKHDAPEFLKKIGDELVFRGMSARFTALVTGTPEPDYEFFFNGNPLFPTDRIHIVRERTGLIRLSMAYVEESDIGVYGLKVTNVHGEAYCEAKLMYDGLEIMPGQTLGELYKGFDKNGVVRLQISRFSQEDVGTYECFAKNDFGEMSQPVIMIMAQYPEFLKAPTDVNLIGVNGGKIECEIFGVPKPKVVWYKDFAPLKEPSERSKQIIPRTKGFEKFYHLCEEIGRGTQGVTYFVQQTVPIEADQSGHHCIEEAESKYWWLHRGVKDKAPTIDPVMVPYRFTGGNFAAKMMYGSNVYKQWMLNELK
ncbi:Muscle Mline assembly protein unc89like [Caligus rogercresseyi]|uniref:Muscle Mline assembly protein unc89like n=1 Tax=Caligus rogercresseyi TaxID=217165 RepID=A0A7T8GU04_CALRO|nr:Muscle Mline assembly protein unc89like [Caligus rogercresseyi]